MTEKITREVEIVEIYPTEFWYEKDMMGTISIKMQHQTMHEFALVQIHYDYAYTSNAHQQVLLQDICKLLGIKNIDQRPSKFDAELLKK